MTKRTTQFMNRSITTTPTILMVSQRWKVNPEGSQ